LIIGASGGIGAALADRLSSDHSVIRLSRSGDGLDVTDDAAVAAALAAIDPAEDNRGPVEFKMHVAGAILRQAIARAVARAGGGKRCPRHISS
ncbi:MAG: hypothetical protein AAF360_18405, partial [Pseudomonadota bacterium]